MIRNIVFDMGNVVIRFDPMYFIKRAGITDETDHRLIMNELFLSVEWAQMDMGILNEDTLEPLVLPRVPERLREKVKHLLHNWAVPREMMPGMEDLVRRLKKAGYGIYLLSNASLRQHEYWPRIPASRYFDGTLVSADVKLVKPQPEIYLLLCQKFRLRPEECFFIDDATLNVEAAFLCGMQSAVFHGDAAEIRRKLADAGVRVRTDI